MALSSVSLRLNTPSRNLIPGFARHAACTIKKDNALYSAVCEAAIDPSWLDQIAGEATERLERRGRG